ncbi:MAG: XPC-binding domain-containing protein, partial [Anaerolineales bacterium]|nr:XPC-binding domain-containing protein [Anaerolineales bacterium]
VVADAEAQIGEALERASRAPVGSAQRAAANKEAGELQALLAEVRDPQQPYAATRKFGERAESQVVRDARRKVDALDRLETISVVRAAVKPADDIAGGGLLHSVEQVNGEWTWVADNRAASGPLFDAASSMFPSWSWRPVFTRGTRKNGASFVRRTESQAAQQYHQTPPEYQLAQMIGSPGFLPYLRKQDPNKVIQVPEAYTAAGVRPATEVTFGQVADMIESSSKSAVVEITPAMIEAMGLVAGDRAGFIAKLGNLRSVYDDALSGTTEAKLIRTSKINVDEWAVEYARTNGKPPSIYHDPGADVGYGNALNDLQKALNGQGTFPAVRGIVEGNPRLLAEARELAVAKGQTVGDLLASPANDEAIRTLLPTVLPDQNRPGLPKALTPLDEAIAAGDNVALADLKIDMDNIRGTLSPPVKNVPIEAVNRLAAAPRLSRTLADDLNAAGIHWQTLIPEESWAKAVSGANALAVVLTGAFDRRPKTIMGLLDALKQIENGNAANMGVGAQMSAEAQVVAQRVVAHMIGDARRAGMEIGVIGMGKNFNPYTMAEDNWRMLQELIGQEKAAGNLYVFRDELGLQYGLKAPPKGKVPVIMESVPGLAEELLVGRFQPWQQRIGAVRVNQAFDRLFHLGNQQITFEARGRFEVQMARYGVPAKAAEAVWSAWRKYAKDTRGVAWRLRGGKLTKEPASSARYATEKNVPNFELETVGRDALEGFYEGKGGIPASLDAVRLADEMRIAGSYTRRLLAGGDYRATVSAMPGSIRGVPLGDFLQRTYGMFAHNEWVTTKYYLFRFALDARFHAQNKVEGAALDWGRASLRVPEIDQGMFGMNKRAAATVDELDTMTNTGYPFAVTREDRIWSLLLKEQPDAIRGVIKENPALMRRAMKEIAENDPELAATIAHNGHNTEQYMKVMDAYYGKLMKSADPEALVKAELDRALIDTPELAEVYSRIYDVNAKLLGDLRAMMYGNPNRGQIERTLNSFLLYWPISYQIKATKWLLNIMYGKIGGVQTGGLGAVALDRMQADHERKLVEDPEYAAFFEEHPTLVFAAQMLLPMSPASMSVGLSPLLRDIFFPETARNPLSMGPIYTVTRFIPGIAGDLYPHLRDVPGADLAYKITTGRLPPKPKKAVAWPPLP